MSQSGSLAGANVYRFSSKEWLATPGLYYYGYRWYAPNLQRWLNRDPIGERGGLNLYAFVGNTATDQPDPFGLTNQPGDCGWLWYTSPFQVPTPPPPIARPILQPSNGPGIPIQRPNQAARVVQQDFLGAFGVGHWTGAAGGQTMQTAISAQIAGLLPVPLINKLPCRSSSMGYSYPTKLNFGGRPQPFVPAGNPGAGQYLGNHANPGLAHSPFAHFPTGLAQGYASGISGVPMPDPLPGGYHKLGQFLGEVLGNAVSIFSRARVGTASG